MDNKVDGAIELIEKGVWFFIAVGLCVFIIQACQDMGGSDPDEGSNAHEDCYYDDTGHKRCTYY